MDEHSKKMIAPIVITVILVIYYILYFAFIIAFLPGIILKLLVGLIPLIFGVGMIYVCIERIKEIEGGEEDDLSKY
ncbi:MAG: hypothetical protein K5656_06425 [Lachnospiraceae bacterium]|nr:hypothetical protein [Lachnospiraceae bacterium]